MTWDPTCSQHTSTATTLIDRTLARGELLLILVATMAMYRLSEVLPSDSGAQILCPQKRVKMKARERARCLRLKWADRHMAGVSWSSPSSGHMMTAQLHCVTGMNGDCLTPPHAGFASEEKLISYLSSLIKGLPLSRPIQVDTYSDIHL